MAINWKNVGEAADVWIPMSQYRVKEQSARKAAAAKTAQDVWNAQVGVLDTVFKENAAQYAALNKGVAEGTFDLSDPTMLDAYTDAFNLSIQSQRDLIEHTGIQARQPVVRDLTTFFSGVMDNWIAKNPKGDFDVMKWGKKDGLWGDVIKRLDKSINREDAHRVWESLWNERAGKRGDKEGVVGLDYPAGGKGVGRKVAAEVLGLPSDISAGLLNLPGTIAAGARSLWTGAPYERPYTIYDPVGGREDWRQTFGLPSRGPTTQVEAEKMIGPNALYAGSRRPVDLLGRITSEVPTDKPVITPTDKSVAMGPFAGLDNGLINGFMARGEDAVAAEVTEIGEDVDELKEAEQRAQEREVEKGQKIRNITQEAATFLANYLQMLLDHGEDEAKSMMSRAFANLSSSAKKDVANYLMSQ